MYPGFAAIGALGTLRRPAGGVFDHYTRATPLRPRERRGMDCDGSHSRVLPTRCGTTATRSIFALSTSTQTPPVGRTTRSQSGATPGAGTQPPSRPRRTATGASAPEPPVASQETSPTRITSGRAESGGYRAASEAQLVQGAATFGPLQVLTQAVGPAGDPGAGSTVPGVGRGSPDREPNASEGQLPPEPAPTASVGQPAGDPPGDDEPPDDGGDDDPSDGKDDTDDSACPWCGQSFRSKDLAGHTASCPERPENADEEAGSAEGLPLPSNPADLTDEEHTLGSDSEVSPSVDNDATDPEMHFDTADGDSIVTGTSYRRDKGSLGAEAYAARVASTVKPAQSPETYPAQVSGVDPVSATHTGHMPAPVPATLPLPPASNPIGQAGNGYHTATRDSRPSQAPSVHIPEAASQTNEAALVLARRSLGTHAAHLTAQRTESSISGVDSRQNAAVPGNYRAESVQLYQDHQGGDRTSPQRGSLQ